MRCRACWIAVSYYAGLWFEEALTFRSELVSRRSSSTMFSGLSWRSPFFASASYLGEAQLTATALPVRLRITGREGFFCQASAARCRLIIRGYRLALPWWSRHRLKVTRLSSVLLEIWPIAGLAIPLCADIAAPLAPGYSPAAGDSGHLIKYTSIFINNTALNNIHVDSVRSVG